MQLKKMREILPKLYTSQVDDINTSLTTSPKQASEDKTNQSKGIEGQNCFYQGAEAETKLSLALCVKCRCVQKLPVHESQKHNKSRQTENRNFVCNNCSLNTSPTFHFVDDNATCIDLESQEKPSLSKTQKTFKVKNFQPDKYYCDKCRFSTKDPLQYKKHVAQHEEIKFVCSHCNYVSYTKGEFQRHLVKHTGTFPYQCQYCDYGAVRHDYIVKHTRRVHETVAEKALMNMTTKYVRKRSCLAKPNSLFSEKQKCDKGPLQNVSSDLPSSTSCSKTQDEITKTGCLSGDIECSPGATSIRTRTILEPAEVNLYENQNVEVEVYSPKKEPVQPGMPLTVIAPSELVVPSNCLAQLLEIKIVNGTQQLVLKLIPLKETSNESINCEDEFGDHSTEQTEKGEGLNSVAENELIAEVMVDKLSSVTNLLTSDHEYKNSECPVSSSCNSNVHSQDTSKINCPKSSSNKERYAKNDLNYDLYSFKDNLDLSVCAAAASSESDRSQNVLLQEAQENNRSFSSIALGEEDILSLNGDDKECRSQFFSSPETHLFETCLVNESFKNSRGGGKFSLNISASSEDSSIGLSKLNSENSNCQNNLLEALELQNVENNESPLEGPVISSVFSLSSGAENIPEGIRWDDDSSYKKSTTMLCRKIAQLMSAAESNVKSTLVASSIPVKSCASNKKVPLPLKNSAHYERNAPVSELKQAVSSLKTAQNGGISSEPSNKEHPQSLAATTKTKSRVIKNTHIATPVFIPKGTVLRVLNPIRSEYAKETGDKNEMLAASTCCNETFLPRPVPFSISEKLSGKLSLPDESELNEQSRNQNISLRHRPKREANMKSTSKQNCAPLQQKSDELIKQSKLASKGQLAPKNKVKQASSRDYLSKKKIRISSETNDISEVMPLLTARRLRLVPLRTDQLIKCPRRNQPVVVLNHPDVDSPEIINVMKIINKYKGNVLKVVLSERTSGCLAVKQYNKRFTFQKFETSQVKKQNMLKMKLKKTNRNSHRVVGTSPAKTLQCMFKCWFCGRIYVDQEEWISHGQRHLIEATKGWDVLSLPLESHK